MVSVRAVLRYAPHVTIGALVAVGLATASCSDDDAPAEPPIVYDIDPNCFLVETGSGPPGPLAPQIYLVASNLEVPWGMAFLPTGQLLVSERPGRVRLVVDGIPQAPIANFNVGDAEEGGALGLVLHPEFVQNRQFYVYVTDGASGALVNKVQRWTLAADNLSASFDRMIIDDIPAAKTHNGGRIKFSPYDGMLYVSTGDAEVPSSSQDLASLAGKILRLTPDGEIPDDNPTAGSPVFVHGVRDVTGFEFLDSDTLIVADTGPDGDTERTGFDELTTVDAGGNLGWPLVAGCETSEEYTAPSITWKEPNPPGAVLFYTGMAIPELVGDLLMTSLDGKSLNRIVYDGGSKIVSLNEIYLPGEPPGGLGRLREAVMGPVPNNPTMKDLYLSTSNCDGKGACPQDKDRIVRITIPAP